MEYAKTASEEKLTGTNLTTISEYRDTAVALIELKHRFQGVVHDVTSAKGMQTAKKDRAELRTLRTILEKTRREIKAPALERCRQIDSEAKRLTEEIGSLEDPIDAQIKAEEGRAEAERIEKAMAEQKRVDEHKATIQRLRDFPLSLQGKPSEVIAHRIKAFETAGDTLCVLEEFEQEGIDAFRSAIYSAQSILATVQQREAETARLAELEAQAERSRQEREELQSRLREAEEREERRREDEARQERERVSAEERAKAEAAAAEMRARQVAEQAERDRLAAIERAEQEAAMQAERERLEVEAERLRVEAEKAEQQRIASLDLMAAVGAVVEHFKAAQRIPDCVKDLIVVWDRQS